MKSRITFLIDFDNTLLDNDKVKIRIADYISSRFGKSFTDRFLAIHDQIRMQKGYVDFPSTINQIASEVHKPQLKAELHDIFHNFDLKSCLFEKATEVIVHLQKFGQVVVLTEGDSHYQTIKIKKSGIWKLVNGKVEIPLINKVENIKNLMLKYPSDIYYFIEDKPELLEKAGKIYGLQLKRIHVCQGHYSVICKREKFDLTVSSLKELLGIEFPLKNFSPRPQLIA